ncbi:MAG: LD-carboxypeptidase [Acidobacteriota bacterium]|nr:LD-carboxypeptidase [Acidobacteriota bacterium]
MNRRLFVQSMLGLGAAPFVTAAPPKKRRGPSLIKPKRLEKGQTVGLIAPASNAFENESIRFAMEIVESLGFKVKPGKHLFKRWGYLAGSDEERAGDLNAMFKDDSVDAVFALRGGYGAPRILPMLNYKVIRKNPKPFLGYSDITALHQAIHKETGLVTFHGPIAMQTWDDYALAEMKKVMVNTEAPVVIGAPPPFEVSEGKVEAVNRLTRIVPGKARGGLTGGNLSLMTLLMGTPYEPDFKDKIVFLEDVGEKPYRVDRMLTHLWLSGKLHDAAGFALGKFTDADPKGTSLSLEEVFMDRLKVLGKPAIRGLMIGHVAKQTTVPMGIQAELDVDAGTLTMLEPAVS